MIFYQYASCEKYDDVYIETSKFVDMSVNLVERFS
jgi:hypothetical protein